MVLSYDSLCRYYIHGSIGQAFLKLATQLDPVLPQALRQRAGRDGRLQAVMPLAQLMKIMVYHFLSWWVSKPCQHSQELWSCL